MIFEFLDDNIFSNIISWNPTFIQLNTIQKKHHDVYANIDNMSDSNSIKTFRNSYYGAVEELNIFANGNLKGNNTTTSQSVLKTSIKIYTTLIRLKTKPILF